MIDGSWRFVSASAVGTSHLKLGTPCQDSADCRLFCDGEGRTVLVVVVSDGAGSASRSDIGSQAACRLIMEQVEEFLASGQRVGDVDRATAEAWILKLQEAIADQASRDDGVPRDYACTLLAAVVDDNAAAFLQIGDGAIVVSEGNGDWCWVHWPQHGEFANTTYFVTDESARNNMAFDASTRRVTELAAFSDGIEALVLHYATQSVHAPFFERMIEPVRALQCEGLDQTLSAALEEYLGSPAICERTDDDKTLLLATRASPTGERHGNS